MSKSETLKQLAAALNAARLAEMGQQIAALRKARIESAEQLAEMLEPLARSMAALAVETTETLSTIGQTQPSARRPISERDAGRDGVLGEGFDDGALPIADSTRAAILAGAKRHLKFPETGSDINRYGYLSGMTNHTAGMRDRGRSRFVLARTADGAVAGSGKKLIAAVASYERASCDISTEVD